MSRGVFPLVTEESASIAREVPGYGVVGVLWVDHDRMRVQGMVTSEDEARRVSLSFVRSPGGWSAVVDRDARECTFDDAPVPVPSALLAALASVVGDVEAAHPEARQLAELGRAQEAEREAEAAVDRARAALAEARRSRRDAERAWGSRLMATWPLGGERLVETAARFGSKPVLASEVIAR